MNINIYHVDIFKIYTGMCVYLIYTNKLYTLHTHIYE